MPILGVRRHTYMHTHTIHTCTHTHVIPGSPTTQHVREPPIAPIIHPCIRYSWIDLTAKSLRPLDRCGPSLSLSRRCGLVDKPTGTPCLPTLPKPSPSFPLSHLPAVVPHRAASSRAVCCPPSSAFTAPTHTHTDQTQSDSVRLSQTQSDSVNNPSVCRTSQSGLE